MFITSIAAFVFAYYFVNVFQGAMLIKKIMQIEPGNRLKPFDCVGCLTVWCAVVLFFCPDVVSNFLAVVFGAGFISMKIK